MTDTTNPSADKNRVVIFDTTLRDGEQSPGATMTLDEKIKIATLLDEMGVDVIEAGFPIASDGDFEAVTEISKVVKNSVVCGLARASKGDIQRAWDALQHAKKPRIHTFIGTSPLHREHQLSMDKEQVLDKIRETVTFARSLCDNVQWSPMDATRTEHDYLVEAVSIAVECGATTINIPDTVGYTAPGESAELIQMLLDKVPGLDKCVIATHCHNDLGMATANALAAVNAGARQIECTINGLGIMPYFTEIDTTKIMQASRMVATVAGFPVQFNKAIVGKNAFAHESGIHQDGMLKHAGTFEIMRPEDVGLTESNLVMGKHSGRAAFKDKLAQLGYDIGDNAFQEAFVRFKALADAKKEVYDDDIIALIEDAETSSAHNRFQVISVNGRFGTEGPQSVEIKLEIDGEEKTHEATGDGPVDASFRAIKALIPHSASLQLYQVHAVTHGTDAQAEVSVRMEEGGKLVTGHAAHTDTMVASIRAYVNALNKLMVRREKSAPKPMQAAG